MPHLEKDIWKKYKDQDVVVLAIGREQSKEEISSAVANKLSMPVIVDEKREIYSKYAKKGIPRNYVIDQNGKVIWASTGYTDEEFQQMIGKIKGAMGSSAPRK